MPQKAEITRETKNLVTEKVKPYLYFKIRNVQVIVIMEEGYYEFFTPTKNSAKKNVSVAKFPVDVLNMFAKKKIEKDMAILVKMNPKKNEVAN